MGWSAVGNIRGPQGPQGIQGPQGNAGAAGPVGPAFLTWQGLWSAANAYAINDAVSWGGSTYFATATHNAATAPPTGTAIDPGEDDSAVNAGWAVLSLQGATGQQGIQGTQGPQGTAGAAGTPGSAGTRGSAWYTGTGAPGSIGGSIPGDKYLDLTTGDVYNLT